MTIEHQPSSARTNPCQHASSRSRGPELKVDADSLEHAIVYALSQDWLDIGTADAYASEFEADPGSRRDVVLHTIRSLASDGLMLLGDVDRLGREHGLRLGFVEWSGSLDDQLDRAASLYAPGDRDAPVWSPALWFDLTARGRVMVERLPWPSERVLGWANPIRLQGGRPAGASLQQIARWMLEESEHLAEFVGAYGPEAVGRALDLIDSTDETRMSNNERLRRARLQIWLHTHLPDGTTRARIEGPVSSEQRRRELATAASIQPPGSVQQSPHLPWSLRDGGTPHSDSAPRHRLPHGETARPLVPVDVEKDSLAHVLLYLGDDDWVAIGELDTRAEHFESEPSARAELCLETVRRLAEAGCIEIGGLGRHDPRRPATGDFMEWPGSLSDRLVRLADIYQPDAPSADSWYWGAWLRLTEIGERALAALPAPDDRIFDDEDG